MKKIFACLSLLLTLGCSDAKTVIVITPLPTNAVEPTSAPTEIPQPKDKILAIGDSITEGTDLSSYPSVLQQLVGENVEVINFGVSGSSAQDYAEFPYRTTEKYRNSLTQQYVTDIVIMFGTNDTSVNSWNGRDEFKMAYVDLVDDYLNQYPYSNVYLCTISQAFYLDNHEAGVAEYGIQPNNVLIVNEVIKEVAQELMLPIIDVFDLTSKNNPWYFDDGIHPNSDGHQAIAQLIYAGINSNQ